MFRLKLGLFQSCITAWRCSGAGSLRRKHPSNAKSKNRRPEVRRVLDAEPACSVMRRPGVNKRPGKRCSYRCDGHHSQRAHMAGFAISAGVHRVARTLKLWHCTEPVMVRASGRCRQRQFRQHWHPGRICARRRRRQCKGCKQQHQNQQQNRTKHGQTDSVAAKKVQDADYKR